MKLVNWDQEKLKLFKKAYNIAVVKGDEVFIFNGDEYLVAYAKYLLEYIEGMLG